MNKDERKTKEIIKETIDKKLNFNNLSINVIYDKTQLVFCSISGLNIAVVKSPYVDL